MHFIEHLGHQTPSPLQVNRRWLEYTGISDQQRIRQHEHITLGTYANVPLPSTETMANERVKRSGGHLTRVGSRLRDTDHLASHSQ